MLIQGVERLEESTVMQALPAISPQTSLAFQFVGAFNNNDLNELNTEATDASKKELSDGGLLESDVKEVMSDGIGQ